MGFWAVLDQMLVSGTTFLTSLLLARLCSTEEFGAYALAFTAMLFLNGFQTALITEPMAVLGAGLNAEDFRNYITTLAACQVLGSAALALATLSASPIVGLLLDSTLLGSTLAGMGTALFFVQCQEFCRRTLFTRLAPKSAFLNDLTYCTLRLTGLWILCMLGGSDWPAGSPGWLTPRNVFLSVALAGAAAMLLGLYQIRSYISASFPRVPAFLNAFLKENWEFAKWGLVSFLGGSAFVQGNMAIVAALSGLTGLAVMDAPRLILAPLQVLLVAGQNIITPRASQKYRRQSSQGLLHFLRPLSILWITAFATYGIVVALAPEFWLRLFYHDKYATAGTVLLIWTAVYVAIGLRTLPWIVVKVLRRPDLATYSSLIMGSLVLGLSALLTSQAGPAGALSARLAGECGLLTAGAFFAYRLIALRPHDTTSSPRIPNGHHSPP